jgi:hypothetical protein
MIHLMGGDPNAQVTDNLGGDSGNATMRRNIIEHNAAGADLGTLTDFNVSQNLGAGAD